MIWDFFARMFGYAPLHRFYTEHEVQESFERYRSQAEPLLAAVRTLLPGDMNRVAIVGDRSAFVYRVDQHPLEGLVEPQEIDIGGGMKILPHLGMAGVIEEEFCMSEELFHMRSRNNSQNKPVYEISVDIVLQALKSPFMFVSSHDKPTRYLNSVCQLETQLERGRILVSPNTRFIAYEERELFDGIDFHSIRFGP